MSNGDKVYINMMRITLTLGLDNKNLIPSGVKREGAFLRIFGIYLIDRTI